MKHCPRCDQDLPDSGFCKSSDSSDGLQGYCRKCFADYRREVFYPKEKSRGYKFCECGCGTVIRSRDKYGRRVRFIQNHRPTSDIAIVKNYIRLAVKRTRFEIEMCCHLGKKEAGTILARLQEAGEIYQMQRGEWYATRPYRERSNFT